MGMNLRPSTYTEGTGLLDDVDVTVKEAAFLMYDFNGSVSPAICVLGLMLTYTDAEGHDAEQQDYLSMGKGWSPSDDGKTANDGTAADYAISLEGKALNRNSKMAKFLESLVNSGFPEDKLDNFAASHLQGLNFHLKREVVKYNGLVRTGKNAAREQTALTASKINKMPWESKPAARTGLGTPKTTTAAVKPNGSAVSAEVKAKAAEQITAIVLEAGGNIAKAKMATAVFAALKGDPDQKAISQLVFKDDFLRSLEGITFDGSTLAIG